MTEKKLQYKHQNNGMMTEVKTPAIYSVVTVNLKIDNVGLLPMKVQTDRGVSWKNPYCPYDQLKGTR